jgi:DNA-directed RNA polymerase specialized sigma24 family protein
MATLDNKFCVECSKREWCISLCPEALLYVEQDNVDIAELLRHEPGIGWQPSTADKEIFENKKKALQAFEMLKKHQKVATLLRAGLSRKEIAQLLGITRENVRDLIRKHKKATKSYINGRKNYALRTEKRRRKMGDISTRYRQSRRSLR